MRQRTQSGMAREDQVTIVKYQTPGHFGRHVLESDETAEFEGLTSGHQLKRWIRNQPLRCRLTSTLLPSLLQLFHFWLKQA